MFLENLKVALKALVSNKLRSVLTTLGIIIGVTSVIALVSLGNGVQAFITRQFEGQGSNLIFVIPARVDFTKGANRAGFQAFAAGARSGTALSLTDADSRELNDKSRVPDARIIAPVVAGTGRAFNGDTKHESRVRGTVPEYLELNEATMLYGSYFDEAAMTARSRVVVLGSVPYKKLFPDGGDPTGQEIRINNVPFRIIGVQAERTGGTTGSDDDVMTMPLTTAREKLFPRRNAQGKPIVNVILIQAANKDRIDNVIQQATEVLRENHGIEFQGEDDFTISSQRDLLSTIGSVTTALTIFLAAIAGISLFVGGIGIMNIMLVSVTERTREIGLRKAVGAKRGIILAQFLIESTVLSLLGGLIGVALGVGLARAVASISQGAFEAVVTTDAILMAVGFSMVVGILFGVYPAARAARLSPIDALRYE
jgi:putative ABC transport system permease protein